MSGSPSAFIGVHRRLSSSRCSIRRWYVRIDETAARPGAPREIHGAETWARGAVAFAQLARSVQPMLVDGAWGIVWAPGGQVSRVLRFTITNGKIAEVDIIADPARLRALGLHLA